MLRVFFIQEGCRGQRGSLLQVCRENYASTLGLATFITFFW